MVEISFSLVRVNLVRLGRRVAGVGLLGSFLLAGAQGQGQGQVGPGGEDTPPVAQPEVKPVSKDAKRLADTLHQIAAKLEAGEMDTATAFRKVQGVQTAWTKSRQEARQAGKGKTQPKTQPKAKAKPKAAAPRKAPKKTPKRAKEAAQKGPAGLTPAEAAANKLPAFGRYDAEQVRIDAKVASGELSRAEADVQLAAFRRQLAINSGRLPANPKAEDMPRYKQKKAALDKEVAQGKLAATTRDLRLRVLRKSIEADLAAEKATARRARALKAPTAKPSAKNSAKPSAKPAVKQPAGAKPRAKGGKKKGGAR